MPKNFLISLLTILLLNLPLFAENYYEGLWTYVLQQYIKPGQKENIKANLINYQELGKDKFFQDILADLANFDTTELKTPEQKLAFWLNVYNIGAINIICNNNAIKSIQELNFLFWSVWDKDAICINQKNYSLKYIKNEVLCKFNDPLINFALCNTGLSSPDIRPESYTAKKVFWQTRQQATLFLQNTSKGLLVDTINKKLIISQIFQWQTTDFNWVKSFIQKYVNEDILNYDIEYFSYNWSLNNYSASKSR